ncbi:MAG: xanthine dehydrogenase family protein molybdopterin-binding subunit, partial [Alphaproteobacteria bacterium]
IPGPMVPTADGAFMHIAEMLGVQVTGGSTSVRVTGAYGMLMAGAATREMLVRAASQEWQVPGGELTTANSQISHEPSGRVAPYADFADAASKMKPSYTPKLKDPADYTIIGTHVPRFDIPAKVDGSAQFAMDVRRPGMVYATVLRSPVFGGSIVSVDDSAARAIKGVLDVVPLKGIAHQSMVGTFSAGEAVAVVAESYWTAKKGVEALRVTWDSKGNEGVSSETIFAQFDRDLSAAKDRKNDRKVGDVGKTLAGAAQVIEADYRVPYLAHACMEPLNATAEVKDGRCEVWVGCQNPLGFRQVVAKSLGLDDEQVTVHNYLMGGGFGRKSVADWAVQAAQIAKVVGRPVQLIWSREEDIKQDFYRPAMKSRFKAGLDDAGRLVAWHNTYSDKMEPIEAPLIPYAVAAQDIGFINSTTHVPHGAWRSVDHSQHGFFTESFVDEVAVAAGQDPYAFRAALLKDHPRHLAVLKRAAEEADWGTPLGDGRGRGIALQESFGSIVAEVVEVSVTDAGLSVDRVVAVSDPGIAVSPDGLAAQLESGIIFGLTAALYGEITIKDGAVVQNNFYDYEMVRMPGAPKIETHIINSGEAFGGAGEPGTPPIAPALANAVFNATGKRLRSLPLRLES